MPNIGAAGYCWGGKFDSSQHFIIEGSWNSHDVHWFLPFISPFLNHIYLKFYLFPAKVVVELAKVHEIQAAVLLHPSLITVDDIKGQLFRKIFFPYTLNLFYWMSLKCLLIDVLSNTQMSNVPFLYLELKSTSYPRLNC